MSFPAPADVAELVRLPAVLSVPGDVLVGAAASGQVWNLRRTVGMVGASSCLYLAGMALNDFFDRHEDFLDVILHLVGLDALLDAVLDLVFLAGQRLDDEPLIAHDQSLCKTKFMAKSTATVNAPSRPMETMTSAVEPFSSSIVGQEHFRNSSRVSWM